MNRPTRYKAQDSGLFLNGEWVYLCTEADKRFEELEGGIETAINHLEKIKLTGLPGDVRWDIISQIEHLKAVRKDNHENKDTD